MVVESKDRVVEQESSQYGFRKERTCLWFAYFEDKGRQEREAFWS